ncbi:small subunit processome component 20 homolog [Venturia canescens]|uniref:small subunit processome component 20 homolog n=1 Tax=Venturia canescens TaxID=32260 RepID=UPI001C9CC072|nr:small subunit processome component 20 homolog [Venturia canescens]XP_043287122.1 small subunit processome component 20 homolog [Venturia canescens]
MKNKPTRHKETNTFKFKKFSERVSEIDIDIFHRVAHRYEEQNEDDVETFFYQTLQKWRDLNLTEGYTAFKKEVKNIVTLPQLLNRRQEVIDILMKYLTAKDNKVYLQPILDLIVAVARDLQKEFYEHFPEFLAAIIDLLNTKDAEQLELAFTALAYLFKFLWRYLIKNVDRTFDLLLPLLAESKPAYVNNFAAESFAYVVRKVRDRDSFFRRVLQTLEEKRQGISGCGRLMFEVILGTTGQFHSCAEPMLSLYLEALEDETVDGELVHNVLEKIFDCVLSDINPQKSEVFWNVLLKFIDHRLNLKESISHNKEGSMNHHSNVVKSLFRLIRHVIDHRNGRMLINPVPLVKKLVRSIEIHEEEDTLRPIIDASVSVLLASAIKLSQETASELVLKLLSLKHRNLIFYVVERLVNYSSFETLVLPHVIGQTVHDGFDEEALWLFATIVKCRSPHCLSGVYSENWKKFPLDFRRASESTFNFLRSTLEEITREKNVKENALKTIIILPHLNPLPEDFLDTLKTLISLLFKKLVSENTLEEKEIEKWNFLFLLAIESLARILTADDFHDFVDSLKIFGLVKKHPNSNSILNAIDLTLTQISKSKRSEETLSIKMFEEMHESLVTKLSSPFHETRLVVSHVYSLFRDVEETKNCPEKSGVPNALDLMFLAENEPATVHKYRDRLVHLRALTFNSQALTNLNSKYFDFPLRYLMGNLWINFSLLWEPVCQAISSYATKECSQFWEIFLSDLKAESPSENLSILDASTKVPDLFEFHAANELFKKLSSNEEKPDHLNYRLLLWRCMEEFVSYCETKNRDLTGLFIANVETNYFKSNSESARSWSIEKKKDELSNEDSMEVDSEDEEEEENDGKEKTTEKSQKVSSKRLRGRGKYFEIKLILAQMRVFAKMSNPRTLYREPEMNKIYMDLLTSKNVEIQKAALDCLFAYKPKYLMPYKENLYSLVDEKNLKNELARFRIDQESSILKNEDREGLMPILMRLIYAKMVMKIGTRTGGKGGAIVRRKIILRFLAGSQEAEMMIFTRMAFKPFEKFVSLDLATALIDLKDLVSDVSTKIDLSNVIPPKRLRSAVNLLSIVIEQFGAKMRDNLLPRLLAILVCILAQSNEILKRSENVLSGYLPTMKSLRTTCINVVTRFFAHFENYPWKSEELDALFDVAVFPLLEKLPIEGIHSPTALLKLFGAWAENPRYYKLLVKHQTENTSLTPLPYIMKLLLGPKTHLSVVNTILEMLQKMLTLRDAEKMEIDEEPVEPITVTNVLSVKEDEALEMNYGSTILMAHVPEILEYLKKKLERSNKGINKIELTILSRLSELVKDPEMSDKLLTLLLPILVKRTIRGETEETILELLTTIVNLVKNVKKPEIHLRAVIPLLGSVSSVVARKLLLRLIVAIAEGTSDENREVFQKNSDLLVRLNAWDQKWIEQPDFEKRLDAFTEITNLMGSSDDETLRLTIEFGVAIIYTCFFFLSHETDLSLRDSSGQCLKSLGPKLAKAHQSSNVERRYLMDETILRIVKNGIKSKNDAVRNQSLALLGEMSLECPEVHPVLRDLSLLANKQDREVDFFENLQHLQLHRRARALLKFSSTAKTFKRLPNARTLTQFIFPIASSYLCNESYANKNSIVDAAIETVGVVCRMLPWHHYEIILKHYLDKLGGSTEFQRQIVRILVAILDAFHYDLSKLDNKDIKIKDAVVEGEIQGIEAVEQSEDVKELNGETIEPEDLLDEALEAIELPEDSEKSKDDEKTEKLQIAVIDRQTILSQSAAKRVVFGITQILLPKLHRSIVARTQHENSHKVNRRQTGAEREEEELTRVPIALAMVKLLQKLPDGILDRNLPGIFMKLCTFLKSRLDSVRRATREILQKIMVTLGPGYLHHLLREMNSLLTKGFQIHVLAYTIHAVLVSLKPLFNECHMPENLQAILSVCKIDLFGPTGEEKEIAAIVKNVSEAKSTKSYDIFAIIGQFVTESCLLDVILPLREILAETRSHRTVRKAVECLRHFVLGLADNSFIAVDRILVFLYGIVSQSIPELLPPRKAPITEKESEALTRQKPDCYLIAPEPKTRMGVKTVAKMSSDTNAHVMMEFALKLFHILLKRDRVAGSAFKSYIDPFVPVLGDCLDSKRVKLSTLALQCLNWILKMDLPNVREMVSAICSSIFAILHKYAAAGLSKGDNFDLVMASFKCMSVLVRDVKHFTMSDDQIKALILYAEQDLHDSDRQATAFNLLKAIISRKWMVAEMHAVMEKVATLSVTSDLDHVRQQSRSVFYSFLMEYPLGKSLDKHISFYLSQLSYEMKPGRLSALEMIHSIVTGFPENVLVEQSGILFFMVGIRLINDDDPTCRKLCAKCIKETIQRVPHNQRVKLFDIVKLWLADTKVTHRTLAAQLCGIFVNVEKESFESRLPEILPLVLKQFHAEDPENPVDEPGRFVKLPKPNVKTKRKSRKLGNINIKDPERMKDHHLFQVLQLCLKISANCPILFKNEKYEDSVRSLAEYSQSLLAHPHLWVRLAATQLIGFVLAGLNEQKILHLLENPKDVVNENGYLYSDPIETLRSLSLDLAAQLQPDMEFEELADQVVKNLVFVARVMKSLKIESSDARKRKDESAPENEEPAHNADISILWLLRRLRKYVNIEITQAPKSTSVRMAMFKWIAGITATIPVEHLNPILFQLMSPLVREMSTTDESNAPLRQLAKEVAMMIKKNIGNEDYARLLVKVQQKLDTRRSERKNTRTKQLVTDPELAARRKIARQQKKKDARKRKMTEMKGKKMRTKRPRKEVDLEMA